MIADFVLYVISRESSIAEVFSSPELDELCLSLGRTFSVPAVTRPDRNTSVYVVTALTNTGGHTRVLLDLAERSTAEKSVVLLTNTFHEIEMKDLAALFEHREQTLEIAPPGNLAARLLWLRTRLSELRPSHIYILQHPFDPLPVAAAQPDLNAKVVFYHNADHSLCLGVHIPESIHVDFTAKSFYNCREREGVSNVIWPLTADVPYHRVNEPFLALGGSLTTCTSGGFEKYERLHFAQQVPYLFNYAEIVPLILGATLGQHIHIGQLSEGMLNAISEGLIKSGIPPNRFKLIPYVPDLPTAMIEHATDIYIGSFPLGGGRTVVQAMGAGIPLIIHSNYRSIFFSDTNEVYPGALAWRAPSELVKHLQTITPEELQDHSAKAREWYERYHHPDRLTQAMALTLQGEKLPPPPRPSHHPNALQHFLDKVAASEFY
jgi:hypothetical protein